MAREEIVGAGCNNFSLAVSVGTVMRCRLVLT